MKTTKKLMSLLLSAIMIVTFMPAMAFAAIEFDPGTQYMIETCPNNGGKISLSETPVISDYIAEMGITQSVFDQKTDVELTLTPDEGYWLDAVDILYSNGREINYTRNERSGKLEELIDEQKAEYNPSNGEYKFGVSSNDGGVIDVFISASFAHIPDRQDFDEFGCNEDTEYIIETNRGEGGFIEFSTAPLYSIEFIENNEEGGKNTHRKDVFDKNDEIALNFVPDEHMQLDRIAIGDTEYRRQDNDGEISFVDDGGSSPEGFVDNEDGTYNYTIPGRENIYIEAAFAQDGSKEDFNNVGCEDNEFILHTNPGEIGGHIDVASTAFEEKTFEFNRQHKYIYADNTGVTVTFIPERYWKVESIYAGTEPQDLTQLAKDENGNYIITKESNTEDLYYEATFVPSEDEIKTVIENDHFAYCATSDGELKQYLAAELWDKYFKESAESGNHLGDINDISDIQAAIELTPTTQTGKSNWVAYKDFKFTIATNGEGTSDDLVASGTIGLLDEKFDVIVGAGENRVYVAGTDSTSDRTASIVSLEGGVFAYGNGVFFEENSEDEIDSGIVLKVKQCETMGEYWTDQRREPIDFKLSVNTKASNTVSVSTTGGWDGTVNAKVGEEAYSVVSDSINLGNADKATIQVTDGTTSGKSIKLLVDGVNVYEAELTGYSDGKELDFSKYISAGDSISNHELVLEFGGNYSAFSPVASGELTSTVNLVYTGTNIIKDIYLNDDGEAHFRDDDTGINKKSKSVVYHADNTNPNNVTLRIGYDFGYKMTSLEINNQNYSSSIPADEAAYVDAYSDGLNWITIDDVSAAQIYNIKVTQKVAEKTDIYVGQFGWFDESYGDISEKPEDDVIINGEIELVKASYTPEGESEIVYYDSNPSSPINILEDGTSHSWKDCTADNEGYATFPKGTKLTIKLTPDYGYQLVGFGVNGSMYLTGNSNAVSTYTFTVGAGRFHLAAKFAEVQAETHFDREAATTVTDASFVTAGTPVDSGTLSMNVQEATPTIDNAVAAVDITMQNVFYAGSNSVNALWNQDVTTFNAGSSATITLDVEAVDAGDTVTVIRSHEGEADATLDATVNGDGSVSFTTDRFSTYTIVKDKEPGPGPGPSPTPTSGNETQAFAAAKTSAIGECDALLNANKDSEYPYIAKLVDDAKKAINETQYDTSKSLAANEAVLTGIVDKLKKDVAAQKILDEESSALATKVKATKVTQKALKTYKTGHKIKVTFKRIKVADKYVTTYQIYRKTGKNGTYKRIKTLTSKKSTITYTNKNLKKGKTYYYKVRGVVTLPNTSKAYTKFSTAKSIKCK